jgi:hypothetical protein
MVPILLISFFSILFSVCFISFNFVPEHFISFLLFFSRFSPYFISILLPFFIIFLIFFSILSYHFISFVFLSNLGCHSFNCTSFILFFFFYYIFRLSPSLFFIPDLVLVVLITICFPFFMVKKFA